MSGDKTLGNNSIVRLTGSENYQDWKFQVSRFLDLKGLWEAIEYRVNEDGAEVAPNAADDRKARNIISLLIEPSLKSHVLKATTARQAWRNLQAAYESNGWTRRVDLQRQLWNCRFESYPNMHDYIARVQDLCQELEDIGAKVEEDWQISIIFSGLTTDYDPLITTLSNSSVKLEKETVIGALYQEYGRKNPVNSTTGQAALYTHRDQQPRHHQQYGQNRGPQQHPQHRQVTRDEFICYRCSKPGHRAAQCTAVLKKSFQGKNNRQHTSNKSENSTPNNSAGKQEEKRKSLLTALAVKVEPNEWYVDSGSTNHMTPRRDWMHNFSPSGGGLSVAVANEGALRSLGSGCVPVKLDGNSEICEISNVLCVPGLSANLLSVSELVKKNCSVVFDSQGCRIFETSKIAVKAPILATATQANGLFKLNVVESASVTPQANIANVDPTPCAFKVEVQSQKIWHQRLGHLNMHAMKMVKSGSATGVDFPDDEVVEPCIPCIKGKFTKQPFKKKGKRAKDILDLIHVDLCGPIPCASVSGSRFIMLLIDDFSRKTFCYFFEAQK